MVEKELETQFIEVIEKTLDSFQMIEKVISSYKELLINSDKETISKFNKIGNKYNNSCKELSDFICNLAIKERN